MTETQEKASFTLAMATAAFLCSIGIHGAEAGPRLFLVTLVGTLMQDCSSMINGQEKVNFILSMSRAKSSYSDVTDGAQAGRRLLLFHRTSSYYLGANASNKSR